ncbi:hypothetical protein NM688_g7873 [Phlebia brevispora]|uniref:Uncharacterized protein n=1 Tax=Phlebia brevispora TaxID=194682 RepID=A0ACC1S036_9APHY|nr:hypothetical protein NM688_g7873 [Phlebia brevispora]
MLMALPFSVFVLSVEIICMILTQFTTAELITWSHVSRYCHTLAIHEWRHRFRVLTAPFTCDMELFEVMLQEFHVYVTGSIALAFMNWRSFHTIHSDLDLYVPDTWADALKAYWGSLEQYQLVATKSFPHILHQYHLRTFMEFKSCCRTVHIITVVDSSSATSAVPSVWCTALMNVVTLTGFYSAYPKLTFAKKGIINGPFLNYDGMPKTVVIRSLNKYIKRGYDIRCSHLDWSAEADPQAGCTGDVLCPRFPRRASDWYALSIPLLPLLDAYKHDEVNRAHQGAIQTCTCISNNMSSNTDSPSYRLPPFYCKPSTFSEHTCVWFLDDPDRCTPCLAVADVPVTFYIIGTVSHVHFFHSDGSPRHHVSLRIVPHDPEDLAAMRRYLRTYANPPIASMSAPSNTDVLEAYKDMKVRLSIHGRAKIESFKDVYQGFNRYGCHWEMPIVVAETIKPGDLVVMECRMVRDDISGSNRTKWRTRLELMAIALALKHDWMENLDGSQDDGMSMALSEEI